ncbi:isoprenylcysteine carboxylmethyltransferase family protein [Paraburkholderia sp. CNPSo 3155]|nr:isoprenylcysteine carboxylmethyltransferase family protein [Paraburkholderia atlantica]NUY34032.1 isoprenylcysteine carboxylmethyltransferase family protein [Paraburkholderia atlantica]
MALIRVRRNPGVESERKLEADMASEDRNEKAEPAMVPQVANPGIIRPPFVYLGAIVVGVLLHFAWPVQLVPHSASGPLGGSAVLVAVVLFVWAVRTLRAADTPVPGNRPTTAIVCKGPFRYSRNPIYLAFSLLQLGVAFSVNSLWLLVTLVPAVALMSLVVIPREERYLESRFPSEYLPYKASVRRWL